LREGYRRGGEAVHAAYREARNRIHHALEREKGALASIVKFTGAAVDLAPWNQSLEATHRGNAVAVRAGYEALSPAPRDDASIEPEPTAARSRVPVRSESV
jgi:hypothetical protein